ncbi:MAG: GspE/PulE family protein [Fimbriimonadaceae bacterium]
MLGLKKQATRLGEVLVEEGVISEAQLKRALEHQKQTGQFLGETLVNLNMVSSEVLGRYLERATGYPFVDLAEVKVDLDVARLVPEQFARAHRVLPFKLENGQFHVGMVDPLNLETSDELAQILGGTIMPYHVFSQDVQMAINAAYDVRHRAESVLQEIGTDRNDQAEEPLDSLVGAAEDAPIVRLVNSIIQGAMDGNASDVHIEPRENNVVVRYRLDGLLYDQMTFPIVHHAATVSRIKIMGGMNIAERRRPQDGRFSAKSVTGKMIDLRVSIMPTIYGEKIVMRLLDKEAAPSNLDVIGFTANQLAMMRRFIKRPHGIVLVTGPTGSGKSTTLYCALQEINESTININTIEDPVEFHLPGINQTQVNQKIGFNFASGLRTLVRQDPDVIMVGEIRDAETAEIAIQAALTGHLVFSTLHTNDAPGAITRLQNMGIEPYLIASAILGVVGQRLVRLVCPHCRESRPATAEQMRMFNLEEIEGKPPQLSYGAGCGRCGKRGLRGRTGVYEVMTMTDGMRALTLDGAPMAALKEQARRDGMMTMFECGVEKMLAGVTTAEEVIRVLMTEEG